MARTSRCRTFPRKRFVQNFTSCFRSSMQARGVAPKVLLVRPGLMPRSAELSLNSRAGQVPSNRCRTPAGQPSPPYREGVKDHGQHRRLGGPGSPAPPHREAGEGPLRLGHHRRRRPRSRTIWMFCAGSGIASVICSRRRQPRANTSIAAAGACCQPGHWATSPSAWSAIRRTDPVLRTRQPFSSGSGQGPADGDVPLVTVAGLPHHHHQASGRAQRPPDVGERGYGIIEEHRAEPADGQVEVLLRKAVHLRVGALQGDVVYALRLGEHSQLASARSTRAR